MWSAAFCSWSSTFFLLRCLIFEVERSILCQNAWCGTLLVDPCIPRALWWMAFCLQALHSFCPSVVMKLFSFLLLIDWLVLRGSGHDAWLSPIACFRLRLRAWCRQKDFDQELYNVYSLFTDTVAPAEKHNKHMLKPKDDRLGTDNASGNDANYCWTPHTANRQHQPSNTTYHQRNSACQEPQKWPTPKQSRRAHYKEPGPTQEHKLLQAFIASEWLSEPKLATAAAVPEAIATSKPLPGNIVQVNEAEATDIQYSYSEFEPTESLTMFWHGGSIQDNIEIFPQ